jgi:hypothetical protein
VATIHRLITHELVPAAGVRPPSQQPQQHSEVSTKPVHQSAEHNLGRGAAVANCDQPSRSRSHQHGCIIRMCRELNIGVERWMLNAER